MCIYVCIYAKIYIYICVCVYVFRGIILLMISNVTTLYIEMITRRVKMSLGRGRKREHWKGLREGRKERTHLSAQLNNSPASLAHGKNVEFLRSHSCRKVAGSLKCNFPMHSHMEGNVT